MNIWSEKFLFSDNQEHGLISYQKKNGLVLYFFPKASTSGCTLETNEFNQLYEEFLNKGFNVIGISRDKPDKQNKFLCNNNIKFPLICDINSVLCQEFKVLKNKKMFNNTFLAIERSTFVVNNDGKILNQWRKVKPQNHAWVVLQNLPK